MNGSNLSNLREIYRTLIQVIFDLAKAHGGKISVNTKERIGAEFSIKLPINEIV